MNIFWKWSRRGLLSLLLLSLVWQMTFFFESRPIRFFSEPRVSTFLIVNELLEEGISERVNFEYSLDGVDGADVILAAVFDWSELSEIEGLQELCGKACAPNSEEVMSTKIQHINLFGFQKIVFVRIRAFFTKIDIQAGTVSYKNEDLQCLLDLLADELTRVRGALASLPCEDIFSRSSKHGILKNSGSRGYSLKAPW